MNLLGRARKIWKGLGPAEPPKPQFYDVACAEGHRLQGQRTESYQALRCPTCGRGVFILPRSPLPEPLPPRSKSANLPSSIEPIDEGPIPLQDARSFDPGGDEAASEVEWLEPEPEESESAQESRPIDDGFDAIIPEALEQAKPERKRHSRPAETDQPASDESRRGIIVVPRRSRSRRPILILVGVVFLVAATVGFRAWRIHRQNLPQQAEADLAAGLKALEAGDFSNAKYKLREAAHALETLGADNASTIRQAAEEAAILNDLCAISLEEMLQEATRAQSPEDWTAQFDRLYKGQAILIEDELAAPTDASSTPFELHLRVFAGAKPAVGRFDLNGLTLFGTKSFKSGTRVTFGARLESIQLQPDGRWRIALDPSSGVLITDFKPLGFLGWTTPEPLNAEGGP